MREQFHAAVLLLLLLLLAVAPLIMPLSDPALILVTCGEVAMSLAPCLPYLLGYEIQPAAICCGGVRVLSNLALAAGDRHVVCNCLKQAAVYMQSLKEANIAVLSASCATPMPFPSSSHADCNL